MNAITKSVIAAIASALTFTAAAQDASTNHSDFHARGPGGPEGKFHRPPSPVLGVLDANHDGVIDAAEIASASAALKKLDLNGDGKLTPDELMPHPPKRDGSVEGPGGQNPPPLADGPDKGPGHRHPGGPLVKALDTNGDGTIDADEINNASKSLLALDKNSDGQLTRDEFAPPRPEEGPGSSADHPGRKPKSE